MFGTNKQIINDELDKRKQQYQSNAVIVKISNHCEKEQIKFQVEMILGSPLKVVASTAVKNFNATWLVLDRDMKNDQRYFLEKLSCNIVRMNKENKVELLRGPNTRDKYTAPAPRRSNITHVEMFSEISLDGVQLPPKAERAVVVVVIQDASREPSLRAIKWPLLSLSLKSGDKFILLGIVHEVYNPMGFRTKVDASSMFGANRQIIDDELDNRNKQYQNNPEIMKISKKCEKEQIKFEIKMILGSPLKVVASKAVENINATWLVLDRHMKNDQSYFVEKVSCNIVRMKKDNKVQQLRGPNMRDNYILPAKRSNVTYVEMFSASSSSGVESPQKSLSVENTSSVIEGCEGSPWHGIGESTSLSVATSCLASNIAPTLGYNESKSSSSHFCYDEYTGTSGRETGGEYSISPSMSSSFGQPLSQLGLAVGAVGYPPSPYGRVQPRQPPHTLRTDDATEDYKRNAVNKLVKMVYGDINRMRKVKEVQMKGLFPASLLKRREKEISRGLKEMQDEKEELEQRLLVTLMNNDVLDGWIKDNEGNTKDMGKNSVNIEEAFDCVDVLSKQMLECKAADLAIEDVVYSLDKAFQEGVVPFDQYLRNVRLLSREQFFHRATAAKVRTTQIEAQIASMAARGLHYVT